MANQPLDLGERGSPLVAKAWHQQSRSDRCYGLRKERRFACHAGRLPGPGGRTLHAGSQGRDPIDHVACRRDGLMPPAQRLDCLRECIR
jgi:hypothetical protein